MPCNSHVSALPSEQQQQQQQQQQQLSLNDEARHCPTQICNTLRCRLAVLDRLLNFIQKTLTLTERARLRLLQHAFLAVVICLNVVGFAANSCASMYAQTQRVRSL